MSTPTLQFRTKKATLHTLLDRVAGVVPSTDVSAVLKNFLIEAIADRITVAATNLEQTLTASSYTVQVDTPGTAVLPARKLLEIVQQSSDGELTLIVSENAGVVQVDKTRWSLKLLHESAEYPALAKSENLPKILISRKHLLAAINAVKLAAAKEPYRQNMRMLDVANNRMRAADGVRFQQVDLGQDFPMAFHIPIGAVDDLLRQLRATDTENVYVAQDENSLFFLTDDHVELSTFKANTSFPNVDDMLLKPALTNDQELVVDRAALVAAVKQVRITANTDTSAVVLSLSKNSLEVSSKDKSGSWSSTELDVQWDGPDKVLGVNHSHLLDMLAMSGAQQCHFFLGEGKKSRQAPLLLKNPDTGSIGVLNQLAGSNFE